MCRRSKTGTCQALCRCQKKAGRALCRYRGCGNGRQRRQAAFPRARQPRHKSAEKNLAIPPHGTLSQRPGRCGFCPAGMFAGLLLARAGLRPIILERGGSVEERQAAVNTFWQMRKLNPSCNVQFGEGGAGTFSDGNSIQARKMSAFSSYCKRSASTARPKTFYLMQSRTSARTSCRKPSAPFARRLSLSAAKCASTRR